jgi:Lactate dehydrogenase and related dehydrogenases
MKKIAIVNSSSFAEHFPEQLERLTTIGEVKRFNFPQDVEQKVLVENLKDFDYIIASVTPFFKKEFFEGCDKLKLISRHGIGYNNVDAKSAREHGVHVTIVEGVVEQDAVAENAIALLMGISRRVVESSKAAKEGNWKDRANFMGYQIRGKTTGIIGLGNIGSRVGSILKGGFKNEIFAYDPILGDEEIERRGAKPVSLETLLTESDFISLNAFLTEENYHMLNADAFQKMKDGVLIVNTARGALVDDKALLAAIESGKVAGYGSDVVENEPVGAEYFLFENERVVISPHTSAYTWECLRGMGEKVVDDVEKVNAGQLPEVLVN